MKIADFNEIRKQTDIKMGPSKFKYASVEDRI